MRGNLKDGTVREILSALNEAGFDFVSSLPDSDFIPLQKAVAQDPRFTFAPCSNESIATGVCAGAWLGGKRPALMIATSGLIVASWPLAAICWQWGIPLLLMIPYRGDIGDGFWIMKTYQYTTEPLLKLLQIPIMVVRDVASIKESIRRSMKSMEGWQTPVALLMTGEVLS